MWLPPQASLSLAVALRVQPPPLRTSLGPADTGGRPRRASDCVMCMMAAETPNKTRDAPRMRCHSEESAASTGDTQRPQWQTRQRSRQLDKPVAQTLPVPPWHHKAVRQEERVAMPVAGMKHQRYEDRFRRSWRSSLDSLNQGKAISLTWLFVHYTVRHGMFAPHSPHVAHIGLYKRTGVKRR